MSLPRLPTISNEEFRLFQELVHREAGISLGENKVALLVGRLSRRLRELGLDSFGAYYRHVVKDDGPELLHMLDCITTNETRFFREPQHFDFLEQHVFPAWRQRAEQTGKRRIRVWSAGCSTGQEPYSLAMVLQDALPASDGWDVEILATDLSTRVLAAAQDAVFPLHKSEEIPRRLLKRFMLRGTGSQEGRMRAGAELRRMVRFARFNLKEAQPPRGGPFDLVFCRNVLIYFSDEVKRHVIRMLLDQVADGGHFFLGRSEVLGPSFPARPVAPAVYVPSTGS